MLRVVDSPWASVTTTAGCCIPDAVNVAVVLGVVPVVRSTVPSPSRSQPYWVIASSRSNEAPASSVTGSPAVTLAGVAESAASGAMSHSGTSRANDWIVPSSGLVTSVASSVQVPASGLPAKALSGWSGR